MDLYKRLANIQRHLKAPKGQYNNFGKYKYRSCEDILESVKPLLMENGCVLHLSDHLEMVGERYYIKAVATLADCETGESVTVSAYAREEEAKKGMDGSQVTGAASSYARKYALNGMFCIDDTKDSDATNRGETEQNDDQTKEYKCHDCGKPFKGFVSKDGRSFTAGQVFHMVEKKSRDGKARCSSCLDKHLAVTETEEHHA